MVIWGDVAYKKDLFFSPDYWRRYFKPGVQAMVDVCHAAGLPVIYHGCGNVKRIFADFIEIGIDAYNPLEAKAGLDVVDLRRKYGHQIGFCGNMDVMEWADSAGGRSEGHRPAQAQRGQRRRYDLPVRPLRAQQRLRPTLRLRRQPGARVR